MTMNLKPTSNGDLNGNFSKASAIVTDPQLETDLLILARAGFRRAPVKFFSANQPALPEPGWVDKPW